MVMPQALQCLPSGQRALQLSRRWLHASARDGRGDPCLVRPPRRQRDRRSAIRDMAASDAGSFHRPLSAGANMRWITLVIGGARSGKSHFAEGLASRHKTRPTYIATAEITDDEMRERIARHRKDRGDRWDTIEAPLDLIGALRRADGPKSFPLIECLTLWINNLIHHGKDVAGEVGHFRVSLAGSKGHVVIVSNEV